MIIFDGQFRVPASHFGVQYNDVPPVPPLAGFEIDCGLVRCHDFGAGTPFWRWGWYRVEEKRGEPNWAPLDDYVTYHEARGRRIVMTLYGTPTWASARPNEPGAYGAGYSAEPADMADWANYCAAVGKRYSGRVQAYEVWNEPNLQSFYTGTKEILSLMARVASTAIKKVDPGAMIISPAITSLHPGGNGLAYLQEMLAASDGSGTTMRAAIDAIGIHLYPGSFGLIKDVPQMIVNVRQAMRELGLAALPLWNTEYTVHNPMFRELTQPQRREAIESLTAFAALNSAGGCDVSIWYGTGSATLGFDADDAAAYAEIKARLMTGGAAHIEQDDAGVCAATIGGKSYVWGA